MFSHEPVIATSTMKLKKIPSYTGRLNTRNHRRITASIMPRKRSELGIVIISFHNLFVIVSISNELYNTTKNADVNTKFNFLKKFSFCP